MMIVVSLLAILAIFSPARSSPISYATYRRRELPIDERPELLLLYDQRGLENLNPPTDEITDFENNQGPPNLSRSKKLRMSRTSLSIVNPLDVLRDRVMLELARRKAMQDQRQIDANRRLLQEIGKRSVQEIDPGYPRTSGADHSGNSHVYTRDGQRENEQQVHHPYTQRSPIDDQREWYNLDDSVILGSSSSSNSNSNNDDETRKTLQMMGNELRLL